MSQNMSVFVINLVKNIENLSIINNALILFFDIFRFINQITLTSFILVDSMSSSLSNSGKSLSESIIMPILNNHFH